MARKCPACPSRTSCASPTIATPRTMARVVCTLWETMETLEPTSTFVSVDLPAFGAPISAMKPQRRSSGGADGISLSRSAIRVDAFAGQHCGGRSLLGRAFGASYPFSRRRALEHRPRRGIPDCDAAPALDLAVGRRRQTAPLRPFLQHRLRVPQRPRWRDHPLVPEPLNEAPRRPDSLRRRRQRRSGPRRRRRALRCAAGLRHCLPTLPSRSAAPRSIARATSAQVSCRTRSARRRDSSPSSPFGKER